MAHEDETDPLVPDPPFEITLNDGEGLKLTVIPGWNEETQESEFEIYSGQFSIAMIRRNPEDLVSWDVLEGKLTKLEAYEIGYYIDEHYFD